LDKRTPHDGFEFSGKKPLADELALHLGDLIASQTFPRGSKLPTTRALAAQLNVSRRTVTGALDRLEEQGLIFRRVGKGTFVKKSQVTNGDDGASGPQIALVSFKYTNPYSDRLISDLFEGIKRVLQAKGCRFAIHILECDPERGSRTADCEVLVNELKDTGPDGVIFTAEPTVAAIRALAEVCPVLQAGYFIRGEGSGYVGADMLDGMRKAIGYLKAIGHRLISLVTSGDADREKFPTLADRQEVYLRVMEEVGLGGEARVLVGGVEEALAGASAYTAAITTTTRLARDLLDAARERGVRVPGELSLVSYDDAGIGEGTTPRFTSMKHLSERMGEIAAQKLLGVLGGTEKTPIEVKLSAELVVRESCAPPRKRDA
jgi:DNA-binding LacI/PurR family transcriptional regulator